MSSKMLRWIGLVTVVALAGCGSSSDREKAAGTTAGASSTSAAAATTGAATTAEAAATTTEEQGTKIPGRDGLTAVVVAQRLETRLRAPRDWFEWEIVDQGDRDAWQFPGLTSAASTATAPVQNEVRASYLDLSIEVYDTVQHRREAVAIQQRGLKRNMPKYVLRKAECGRILVSTILAVLPRAAQEREFARVRRALASAFGPC